MESFDLIVIGGGCNGTGIARDAAMRGLKVLLIEKKDFSSGTTGASSGMIHGGPRYLLYEINTTKLACQDAQYIRRIAPHLCFRIPFVVPVKEEGKSFLRTRLDLELMETFFETYDPYSKIKGGKPHTRLSRHECFELEPGLDPDTVGAITFDEWGIDTARLCVANALSAKEYGAKILNHTELTEIIHSRNEISGVRVKNTLTGKEDFFGTRVLFNAAGPWAPKICALAGIALKLRPGKGIHLLLDRRITNVAVVSKCVDGRQIFINPHENMTLVGTTDDDYYGDLDDIPILEDEVEYLLEGMERVYPHIRDARIVMAWRGLRPTLWAQDVYEDELSREHEMIDHETRDGMKGLFTMCGGKLASFRVMSEEAVDLITKRLGITRKCTTHQVALPGGDAPVDIAQLAEEYKVHPYVIKRLVSRHGTKARDILNRVKANPAEAAIVCTNEPVIEAEIRHVIRHEWALDLDDIFRRTRLAMGASQGTESAIAATHILSEEKKLNGRESTDLLASFLEERWKERRSILRGQQLVQEQIMQFTFQGTLDLKHS